MDVNGTKETPAELKYILECCKAFHEKRYEDALLLLKEGLRENVGIADKIETAELITMFRTLVTVIESSLDSDFGIELRKAVRLERKEAVCSFCGAMESEAKKIVVGPSASICNKCIETCSQTIKRYESG